MKNLLYISLLFCYSLAYGQGKTYVTKQKLQIGEQTDLVYEFSFPENEGKVGYQPQQKELLCTRQQQKAKVNEDNSVLLEIIAPFKDTLFKKGKHTLWRGTYTITAWDTGLLLLPVSGILWQDSLFELPSILLEVSAPKTELGKDIYDIREQFVEVPFFSSEWFKENWLWLSILLILLAIGLFFILRRRKNQAKPSSKELTLREKSILALDALEKAKMWEKNALKEHYFELSYLIRAYLGSRYELSLLESTSQQTTILLTKKGLAADTVQTIKTVLDYADMAKFAKAAPGELEIYRNLAQARQIIEETSPIEIEQHVK